MKILAIEFSSAQRSAAVLEAAVAETAVAEVVETGGRSTKAMGMIEEVLRQAQTEREQIELLAVGLGPGSYTGIRAAISVAQGWQLGREVKVMGISSVEVVASQARENGLRGKCVVIVDAQRNELYLAEYDLNDSMSRQRTPLRLATLDQAQALAETKTVIGPEVNRWFARARVVFPSAAMLAKLARNRTDFVPGEQLEPIYLRQPSFVKAPPPRIIR